MIIENGIITQINSTDISIRQKDFDIIDAQGRVVTVPNVNFTITFIPDWQKVCRCMGQWKIFLKYSKTFWWKLDMLLDHEMIKASADMAAIESIRNGVTYIFDHASPSHTLGSLNCIKETLCEFNIRNVLCFETSDRNGEQLKEEAIKENQNYFLYNTNENSKGMFGLHASFTLDDSTLNSIKDFLAKNDIGIHIHICEDESDRNLSMKKYGKSPVQRLLDFNLVNEKSILVHGVHITKEELDSLKDKKPALAINLDSKSE
ncbi:MAG: amidohydrolase family protein [Ignavibacteriales bacterium]|nr:amidohydrolase family protein [Ignavibacteriales bacterium]